MKDELEPHVRDIVRALGGKVSEQEVERELGNYLNVYRVSLDTAKRSIVKKHGGNPADLSLGVTKTVRDLVPGEQNVNLLARIVSVNEKEVETEGGSKAIRYGFLGDGTGTIPYTAWNPDGVELAKGDVVRIQNAYTKEFKGRVEVHLGARAVVTKEDDALLPAVEPSRAAPAGPATAAKVGELRERMGNVALTARVLSVEAREVKVDGEAKTVYSGVLADESGKVQFSAWKDFGLAEGDVLRIEGGYVKSWRGIPQLSFDERATVTKLAADALPPREALAQSPRMWIEDLAERGGAVDATVRGILIDVKDGSGLIYRCPECRRVLRKNTCRIHGEVQGLADLRVKAVVDDGSGALTAVFGKDLTELLLEKTIDECIAQAKEAMDQEVVRDELADLLIAQPVEIRGNVTSDDYGLMMIVDSARILKVDVQEEARAMLEELEG
ncbi:MAG: DNA-binding protein [Euryarchaeota archaeon]|nr:DNA-binding protein [Euryarchaeota archaeon]